MAHAGTARGADPECGAAYASVTVATAFRGLARQFRAAGIASPDLDARVLVCAACGLTHEAFVAAPERPVAETEAGALAALGKRRLAREPVSRILGVREFRGRDFRIGPATLDPRPDSETVVDAALALLGEAGRVRSPMRILDLGTGTGCLLLTLLAELPQATGVGVDLSPDALAVAGWNAAALGLTDRSHFVNGSWDAASGSAFDVVVANPPYVPAGAIDGLAPEVALHEPRLAIDGGADGLEAYREIAPVLVRVLTPGGVAVLEIGAGQESAVGRLLTAAGLGPVRAWRDLAGVVRCLSAGIRDGAGRKKELEIARDRSRVAATES